MSATFTDDEKIARAVQVLGYFHNRAVANWSQNYSFQSAQALDDSIEVFAPGFSKLYGQAIGYATDLTEAEIQDAMVQLADDVQGVPPGKAADLTAFYDALSNKLANWDFSKWGSEIATATVQAAGQVSMLAGLGLAGYAAAALGILYITRRA